MAASDSSIHHETYHTHHLRRTRRAITRSTPGRKSVTSSGEAHLAIEPARWTASRSNAAPSSGLGRGVAVSRSCWWLPTTLSLSLQQAFGAQRPAPPGVRPRAAKSLQRRPRRHVDLHEAGPAQHGEEVSVGHAEALAHQEGVRRQALHDSRSAAGCCSAAFFHSSPAWNIGVNDLCNSVRSCSAILQPRAIRRARRRRGPAAGCWSARVLDDGGSFGHRFAVVKRSAGHASTWG